MGGGALRNILVSLGRLLSKPSTNICWLGVIITALRLSAIAAKHPIKLLMYDKYAALQTE
jgi:hypothetical protein